eukprot:CAMPEP_0174760634 /NCGR_PEP_ID=MMETSP1094-20130205/108871_1 /TAXON_ID=156173 /ORGANISM="Chrysochromulina brevifilum, Strain UTEX LB 985" /LENGTH=258 /DNA_ID=CAMNT_0015966575 /DNA_START=138 /DNA_END=914 /DNA_ORIENTATION=-
MLASPPSRRLVAPPVMEFVDLFPDPAPPPVVGGNVVLAPAGIFPSELEQPAAESLRTAGLTPWPEVAATVFAPLESSDVIAALFLGVALMLGPDFILAPAGLVSNKGIRPGYFLESVVGRAITPDDEWLQDRREELAASAPLRVRALVLAPFLLAGLLVDRLLLVALEDPSFVLSLGIIGCFGGGCLEVIREPLPSRSERDLSETLAEEFLIFSSTRLRLGGQCHESEIVSAFRQCYSKYRFADMGNLATGSATGSAT